ncbi:lipopolysaccharide biosynthesis protein [Alistipes finegoldii]|mgnify:CR=1 FL=1|uniref:lipopolysaccharide biosynthesis protein n=1 Tax=Alistipes finegoldii TaxID=214856 RepID=UPI00280578A9|nr:oligosaccharide flippase family protein [uncultured Alistipes sp.]
MLEKLAKQTAVYGISTIVVRFLSYLLTPYYTRIFGQETYGIVTDIYALIPLALTLLTMGMESSYFRFSAKAEEAGGDVRAAKRRLFATTWGVTSLAAVVFFVLVASFRNGVAGLMGEAYAAHPEYVVWVGLIILFDVWACIPFSRLREQGRALLFVGIKALNVVMNVALAVAFGVAGLFATEFGVGWVFVANLIASVVTWLVILATVDRTVPKINWALLAAVFAYSLPLLVGGLAGTANEFIDRQLIKYLVPEGAMAQVGIYGAITKIAVVMMLFYQMYRLAAEPFFLSNFKKSDFVQMNAAALKYYVMASMLIFLGIALFRDVFALIVGRDFREGIFILPVVLGANVLTGVWLNLSFWYKREEKTSLAIVVTGAGLVSMLVFGFWCIPVWGYYGAAWARLASELTMVAVSWWLNRRFYPTPYDWRRIGEYVAAALAVFAVCEAVTACGGNKLIAYAFNIVLFAAYALYLVRRERIDVAALVKAALKRK